MVCEKEKKDDSNPDDLKKLQINRLVKKIFLRKIFGKYAFMLKSFSNNIIDFDSILIKPLLLLSSIIFISSIAMPSMMIGNSLLWNYLPVPLFIIGAIIIRETMNDFLLYNSAYKSIKYNRKILSKINYYKNAAPYTISNFTYSFSNFRNKLKKHIGRANIPLTTCDYMTDSTFKEIDIFFDVVIQTISKRSGYFLDTTPEYAEIESEFIKTSPSDIRNFLKKNDLLAVNHKLIKVFLNSFTDKFIERTKPVSTKLISVKQFFEEWNRIIACLEPDAYEKSEEKISKFYDKKYERYEERLKSITTISENIVASLITVLLSILAGAIIYYYTLQ